MTDAPFGTDTPHPAPHAGIATPETLHVDDRVVACDGGGGAAGHPLVYLRIEHQQTFCPWCSRIFVLNEGMGEADH